VSNVKPPNDPFIEAQIESSLAPYRDIAPPAVLAAMRASLEAALTTHPVAVGLIKQLRDHAAPNVSGEEVPGDAAGTQPEKKSTGEEGK
jgi:hypothetical protein